MPVLLMLEADHASGGLMILRIPDSDTVYVLAPVLSDQGYGWSREQ